MSDIEHIKEVAVIGTGFMGQNIATVALLAGFEKVVINDLNLDVLDEAAKQIKTSLTRLTSIELLQEFIENSTSSMVKSLFSKIDPEIFVNDISRVGVLAEGVSVATLMSRLIKEVDLIKAVATSDFIIEAVSEDMEVKQKVFQKLHEYSPPHAILATNSSSLSISKIAKDSGRPDKVIGMHFFHPLVMKLIEITKGDNTEAKSAEIGAKIAEKLPCMLGKRVIIRLEKESPGFIANRIQTSGNIYTSWLIDQAAEKGIKWEQIDADLGKAISISLFETMDIIGLDVVYDVLKYMESALSPDFAPGKILTNLYKTGNLGVKTGKGFFEWNEDNTLKTEIDKENIQPSGLFKLEELLAVQLNEGCRILEEGIVSNYRIIDKAMTNGYSTPGPFIAGKNNYKEWSILLENLAERSGKEYLRPCELMKSGRFLKMRR